MEENVDKTVTLSCSARGFPAPSIVWTTSDGQVQGGRTVSSCCPRKSPPHRFVPRWGSTQASLPFLFNIQVLKTASHRETDGGVHSSVQFTVTSDVTAFCNVSNEFGADAVTFDIKTSEFPVSGYICSSLHFCPPPRNKLFLCSWSG